MSGFRADIARIFINLLRKNACARAVRIGKKNKTVNLYFARARALRQKYTTIKNNERAQNVRVYVNYTRI